ncbi:MAG: hypothetical protein RR101_15375, partial [Burkholderiaceae bacterium]
MSTTTEQAIHQAAIQAPCGKCLALPGVGCRTSTGKPTQMHTSRLRIVREVYRRGLIDGAADVLTTARVYADRVTTRANAVHPSQAEEKRDETRRANAVRGL